MPSDQPVTIVKSQIVTVPTQNPDRSLRWPDPQVFTWIKVPGMPWVLAGFAPLSEFPR